MRPILLLIPITLGITPLAAQLTPEQRHVVEVKAANATLNRDLQDQATARALAGDPTAYAGQAARRERIELNERFGYSLWLQRVTSSGYAVSGEHWFALGTGPASLRSLKRIGPADVTAKAGRPNVLTIATPAGGPARSLMIRTAVAGDDPNNGWSRMGEVTGDPSGRYIIAVPALSPGTYDLQIDVYDPDHPEAPSSGSRNRLVVK